MRYKKRASAGPLRVCGSTSASAGPLRVHCGSAGLRVCGSMSASAGRLRVCGSMSASAGRNLEVNNICNCALVSLAQADAC
eukprot:5615246-Pyramimonas_sp.AAC.1